MMQTRQWQRYRPVRCGVKRWSTVGHIGGRWRDYFRDGRLRHGGRLKPETKRNVYAFTNSRMKVCLGKATTLSDSTLNAWKTTHTAELKGDETAHGL